MAVHGMITSKDIISKTGISRATLNNYIKLGILPRPVVGPPRPGDHGVKQIGYFPEEVIVRLDRVKLMKDQGRSMEEISRHFQADQGLNDTPAGSAGAGDDNADSAPQQARPYTRSTDRELRVTICDITSPAYLVGPNYEIEWINRQAEDFVFGKKVQSLVESESRNIFRLFLDRRKSEQADEWMDLTSLHMTVLQKGLSDARLSRLYSSISLQEAALLRDIFNSRVMMTPQQVYRLPVTISLPGNVRKNYLVHTMTFREGTFFVYLPDEGIGSDLMAMLGQRERVIGELLKRRMPSLLSMCVLFADLQDSMRISAELLPGQYFELINGLWEVSGPVFEKFKGVYGKHVGDGVLYYFLDRPGDDYINNCVNCALDLRDVMFEFSEKWKERKGWDNDLFLNTGINEGQEFFGTIRSADNIEFTALGDTINTAARLSQFAKNGQIWTTKNLVSKLSREDRNKLRFGVHRDNNPANRFVRDSFARVADLIPEENRRYHSYCTIAGLPITEIKERIKPVHE
jgi:class 3 adenylate cyclase/DNA-binding transcriptional MerR regulator